MNTPLTVLRFGNTAVIEPYTEDGDAGLATKHRSRPDLGQQITEVHVPDHVSGSIKGGVQDFESVLAGTDVTASFRHVAQVLAHHTSGTPVWVVCEGDQELGNKIASFFGIAYGEPEGWIAPPVPESVPETEVVTAADVVAVSPPIAGGSPECHEHDPGFVERVLDRWREEQLKTNGGIDLILNSSYGTAAQPAAVNYVALTATAITPAAGDTTLSGEITTAGGGLIRKQATYAHTTGTNTATLTTLFTANGSDVLPVTVKGFGIFNASSAGTMGIEDTVTNTTFNTSGDNSTLTVTFTLT